MAATVARLESTLTALLQQTNPSAPPPLPPKGLRPSPKRDPPLIPAFTPEPPQHPAPVAAYTPVAPHYPAPLNAYTPLAPKHPAPLAEASQHLPPPPPPPPPEKTEATNSTCRLPSSAIQKGSLTSVTNVVQNNADVVGKDGRMGAMAVALAREAFFGDVMSQCTAKGYGDKPGLPMNELMALKEEIRKLYPNYWNNPVGFEDKWNKCSEAISQACKRIRQKRAKKGKQ